MKNDPKLYAKALAAVAAGPLDPEKEERLVRNFLRLIQERGAIKQLPKIIAAAEKALRQKEGVRKVTIESARPLGNARATFGQILKQSDIVEEKINREIVAGVKITLDDSRQFDGSLAHKLNRLFAAKE